MNKHTKFAAALMLAASVSFVYVACKDDDNDKNDEPQKTSKPLIFRRKSVVLS